LILAGGEGRRLSPDKPLFLIEGRPIIERVSRVVGSIFDEVVIVTGSPEKYAFLGLPCVPDERPGCGPLMGIYSGLKHLSHETAFVCASDMPFLSEDIIRAELREADGCDVLVPYPAGLPEFLHGVYSKRCLPMIKAHLDAGRYKIDALHGSCDVKHLDGGWFSEHGFGSLVATAFANVNTPEDYRRWQPRDGKELDTNGLTGSVDPDVLREIRRILVRDETTYQNASTEEYDSLWSHSFRVGRIAHFLATEENIDPTASLLAGLLHDIGKFAGGVYHPDATAEEEQAARTARGILEKTEHGHLVGCIEKAILSLYREDVDPGDVGRVLYDADRLDKMGCMGIAQFFAKSAVRRRVLDDDLLLRASIELTYAHHAPGTLKTGTGRRLAASRGPRVRDFYAGLIEEWRELGLGSFSIREADVAGIAFVLVLPDRCACGGDIDIDTDIEETVKCRSAHVRYTCPLCGRETDFSFCLPNIEDLPPRREQP
jgi:uncharacterized protein